MIFRETAWRVFAGEINSSSLERKGGDEKSPSYLITPLGTKMNRVLIAGVLLDKENTGNEEEPMWRARLQDVSGSYYLNVGRYQPEAAASIASIDTPAFVAIVGKLRTYKPDEEKTLVSVRPEKIIKIDENTRNRWILEASLSTWKRLGRMKTAVSAPDATADMLVSGGMDRNDAEGILDALEFYGTPDSSRYLKLLQNAMRTLLPDMEVDLGLPEDVSSMPDEIDVEPQNGSDADTEDVVLDLLGELDTDGRGAPVDELIRRAEADGISGNALEELTNSLMDKGLIYEPVLGRLKRID